MGWKGSIYVDDEEYMVTDDYDTKEEAEEGLKSLLRDFGDETTFNSRFDNCLVEAGVSCDE